MNILLVDDEILAIQYIAALVDWASLGHSIAAISHSVAEAKEILSSQPIDLVIFDVYMPEENGVALSSWISTHHPDVGMLALSSHDTYDYVREILRNGAFDYILKHRLNGTLLASTLEAIEASLIRCSSSRLSIEIERTMGDQKGERRHHRLALSLDEQRQVTSCVERGDGEGFKTIIRTILGSEQVDSQVSKFMIGKEIFDLLAAWAERYQITFHQGGAMERIGQLALEDGEVLASYLGDLYEELLGLRDGMRLSPFVQLALSYIDRLYAMNISLTRCAKSIGVNASYLSRIFHDEMKVTFSRYLGQVRINCAKKKILKGLPLKQVATECGFKNYNYFFKVFKDYEGITPLGYMDQMLGKKN